jgi:hypothetical protein
MRPSRIERDLGPDAEGRRTFVLRFDVEEEAAVFVLGLGDLAEILEPRTLRARVAAAAARVVALYTDAESPAGSVDGAAKSAERG